MKRIAAAFFGAAIAATASAQAMKDMPMKDHKGMDMKMEKTARTVHKASGKVTKTDPGKGTLTIAHGPVATINWPSMTMAFKVKDKAMLDKVKPGDQVQFDFTQSGRDYVITEIK